MPGYEPKILDTQNIKLIQLPIYDEEGELIHPALYEDKLSEGQIVEVEVSMEGMHVKAGIVSHHHRGL
jgi:hypothetical protein